MQEEYARSYWQDYVADTLGGIFYGLTNIGNKNPDKNITLYSDIAHKSRKKSGTDNMTAEQIVSYIANKL